MATPGTSASEVEALNALVDTSLTLVQQLEKVLSQITAGKETQDQTTSPSTASSARDVPEPPVDTQPVDALSVAGDSASLIRAHSTKISLFIINNPFTPTAIIKVLRELNTIPVPGLVLAVQACAPDRYTQTVRRDLSIRCSQVLLQLKGLLMAIPRDGRILPPEKKNGVGGRVSEKGSIAITGVLWAACDEVIRFSKLGATGHLVQKVDQLQDTLKDILEELKEWGDESDDDGEDYVANGETESDYHDALNDITNDLGNSHISTQALVDNLMSSQRRIPKDDPENIRDRLDLCLRRLRLTALLYSAIVKRRLKTLPSLPSSSASTIPSRLDNILPILRKIPELFGDLAAAFYELSPIQIDRLMDQCSVDAVAASESLVKSWDGKGDGFSDWALKFQAEIKKA